MTRSCVLVGGAMFVERRTGHLPGISATTERRVSARAVSRRHVISGLRTAVRLAEVRGGRGDAVVAVLVFTLCHARVRYRMVTGYMYIA